MTDVSPDGPAYRKLSAAQGNPDLILEVNGKPVRSRADFRTALDGVKTGDIVTLELLRRSPDGWDTAIVRLRAR